MTFQPDWGIPPGDLLLEEMYARMWTREEVASLMDVDVTVINGLLRSDIEVTPEIAEKIHLAFGTSAQLWINLESRWQEFKASRNKSK